MRVHVCMHVCGCVFMCVHVCVYMFMCVHVCGCLPLLYSSFSTQDLAEPEDH